MEQFVQTKLFFLIEKSKTENTTVSEWEKSYKAFAKTMFAAEKSMERIAYHNSLRFAHAEFVFLQEKDDLKKKCTCI